MMGQTHYSLLISVEKKSSDLRVSLLARLSVMVISLIPPEPQRLTIYLNLKFNYTIRKFV